MSSVREDAWVYMRMQAVWSPFGDAMQRVVVRFVRRSSAQRKMVF